MTDLTDEQCDEFRRLPGSFNDMVRAIYRAGRESTATPPADAALADDALCESLIEASDMRWNGDVYVGDGADLMNLVRAALRARAVPEAVAKDVLRDVLASLDGIATVSPKYWEVPRDQFIDEFLPWAQSRARDSAKKLRAILSTTDSEGRKDE